MHLLIQAGTTLIRLANDRLPEAAYTLVERFTDGATTRFQTGQIVTVQGAEGGKRQIELTATLLVVRDGQRLPITSLAA